MHSSKYKLNDRNDYSCIDLRILKRDHCSRQPWPLILFQRLKKAYEGLRRANLAFSSFFSQDHWANRFIWAAGLVVFISAMLK